MSYQLNERTSKSWLQPSKMPEKIGPGSYEYSVNSWNRNVSRDAKTRVISRGTDQSSIMDPNGKSSMYGESDVRDTAAKQKVPFNSRIERGDCEKMGQTFNPAPGTYQNISKTGTFKYDFITRESVAERRIFSQGGGNRQPQKQ